MAGSLLWSAYAGIQTGLSTELNSLADGVVSALSTEIDNTSSLFQFLDLQLDLASLTISSASAFAQAFVVPSVDGTNYPDWSSGAVAQYHMAYAVGPAFQIKAVSATTARANVVRVPIPPSKYKIALRNGTGATLASSGNTLKYRAYAGSYT